MLELVFLRLPLPLHLVRAACTCSCRGIPATRDLLALDFLPPPESSEFCWDLADVRGGLLLLLLFDRDREYYSGPPARLVVCDPRTQDRAIPLSAWFHGCDFLGAFLLDGEEDAGGSYISLSNFRVTCVLDRNGVARACMFSSSGRGRWTSGGATKRGSTAVCGDDYWTAPGRSDFAGSTETSAYWIVRNGVLALDKEAAQLSVMAVLPYELRGKSIAQDQEHVSYSYELPPPMIRACLS